MIKFNDKKNQGFTLIEGLVALAILAIFIPLLFSLNSYINKSFSVANRQSDLQFYSRLAKIKIEKEIEFVSSLIILSSNPNAEIIPIDHKALCINSNKKIVIRTVNSDNVMAETTLMEVPSGVEMDLSFNKVSKSVDGVNVCGDKLLGFTITCSNANDVVSLESSYLLRSASSINGESGIAIIYPHPVE